MSIGVAAGDFDGDGEEEVLYACTPPAPPCLLSLPSHLPPSMPGAAITLGFCHGCCLCASCQSSLLPVRCKEGKAWRGAWVCVQIYVLNTDTFGGGSGAGTVSSTDKPASE